MARAISTAVQITLFGGAVQHFAPGRARQVAPTWRKCREDWIEMLDHTFFPANHHAVASLQSPYAAARSHVHIMDALRRQFPGPPDVIHVIGISAVNEN